MKIIKSLSNKKVRIFGIVLILGTLICFFAFIKLKNDTKAAEYHFRRALDYYDNHYVISAKKSLTLAIKKKKDPRYFYAAFKLLWGEKKYNEANFFINEAIKLDHNNLNYLFEGAQSSVYTGKLRDAIIYMKRVVHLEPRNSDYKLYLANILYSSGENDQSIRVLKQIIKEDQKNYDGWDYLANLYFNEGLFSQSYNLRLQASKLFPDNPNQLFKYAVVAHKIGKTKEAIVFLKKSIYLRPSEGKQSAELLVELAGGSIQDYLKEPQIYTVAFTRNAGTMSITALFEGVAGRFLVDTGASHSVVYTHFLDKNSFSINRVTTVMQYQTAGGLIQAPILYGRFDINNMALPDIRTAVINSTDTSIDGIIGQNILSRYKISIDNDKNIISFTE
jgi:tetratricopeptide (TPR) repeat protein